MRIIGFSTGSLAFEKFRVALEMMQGLEIPAVELSALRLPELEPLVHALNDLKLADYQYISVHAPSKFTEEDEPHVVKLLGEVIKRKWPVVLHPDTIYNFDLWKPFGDLLCIENMDKRKSIGRSVSELEPIFQKLPEASLCFDIGHARQVDTTMIESRLILNKFQDRLRQVHMSDVSSSSQHERLNLLALWAFQKVGSLIPEEIPIILEIPIPREELLSEMELARKVFQSEVLTGQ